MPASVEDRAQQRLRLHFGILDKTFHDAGLSLTVKGLYDIKEAIVFEDKTFRLKDGTDHYVQFGLKIAVRQGRPIWACVDGSVIKEGQNQEASIVITQKLSVDDNIFYLQFRWAATLDPGFHTPMGPNHLALVLYDLARWARLSNPDRIDQIPLSIPRDLATMLKAFQMQKEQGKYRPKNPKVKSYVDHTTFRSKEAEAEFDRRGSVAERSDDRQLATTQNLTAKLDDALAGYLPHILSLKFFRVPRKFRSGNEYLGIRQLIASIDYKVEDRPVYTYFNTTKATAIKAPAIEIVVGGPINTPGHETDADDDDRRAFDVEEFLAKVRCGEVKLCKLFRPVRESTEQFRALAKYCFILASETRKFGDFDHRMPLNPSFEIQLKKACKSMQESEEGIDGHISIAGSSQGQIVKMHHHRTNNSSNASMEAELPGSSIGEVLIARVAKPTNAERAHRVGSKLAATDDTPADLKLVKRDAWVGDIVWDSDSQKGTGEQRGAPRSYPSAAVPRLTEYHEKSVMTESQAAYRNTELRFSDNPPAPSFNGYGLTAHRSSSGHAAIVRSGKSPVAVSRMLASGDMVNIDATAMHQPELGGEQDKENSAKTRSSQVLLPAYGEEGCNVSLGYEILPKLTHVVGGIVPLSEIPFASYIPLRQPTHEEKAKLSMVTYPLKKPVDNDTPRKAARNDGTEFQIYANDTEMRYD